MYTKSLYVPRLRTAMHWLCAGGLLLGLWAAGVAQAQQKKDLIEIPLIKKFKEDKAAAEAEAADAKPKHGADKPAAKAEDAPAAKHETGKPATKPETAAANPAHKQGEDKPAVSEKNVPSEEPVPPATGPAASESVKQLRQALTVIGTPSKQAAERAAGGHSAAQRGNTHGGKTGRHAPAKEEHQSDEHGHSGEVHWSYEGENGPQTWGTLKPEFNLCAIGKRQSPIAIRDDATLQGPAEAIQFQYTPSNSTVVNNGHTIQVNMEGDNSIVVRNSTYKLLQFHFHTPSEEMINTKRYPMVAHLVHKNEAGQLAVVAVLLEQGEPNPLIETVWTYMPLDTNDQVRIPTGLIDVNEILPADQRYYQFFGSLTTPPCSEGVLWMVIKQPLRISPAQFKLFRQLFPFNARPVQAVNGRPVREAR
jgi:carbonic anhydrase